MNDDMLHTFLRCRAAALAALVSAGGKPCRVLAAPAASGSIPNAAPSAAAPAAAVAAQPLSPKETRKLAGVPDRVSRALAKLLGHLPPDPPPLPRRPGVAPAGQSASSRPAAAARQPRTHAARRVVIDVVAGPVYDSDRCMTGRRVLCQAQTLEVK
jgi:hypothetical protein